MKNKAGWIVGLLVALVMAVSLLQHYGVIEESENTQSPDTCIIDEGTRRCGYYENSRGDEVCIVVEGGLLDGYGRCGILVSGR